MYPPPDQIARIWRNLSQSDRIALSRVVNAVEGTVLDIRV